MTPTTRRLVALGLFAGLVACTVLTLPPGEPRHEGKPLHYWLARTRNETLPHDEQQHARTAVITIGTNNLSLLLKWFCEDEPSDTEPAYRRAIKWLQARLRPGQPFPETFRPSRPGMAYWVFLEFPEVASSATPRFIAMLSSKEDVVKGKASVILPRIGTPAVPALVRELANTNDVARALVVADLGEIGADAEHLRPRLEAMLSDRATCVRLNAAVSLGKLGGKPEIFVPIILRCTHDADEDTRMYALDALGKFKDRARSAVPDLTSSIKAATNINYRYALLCTLRDIDPEQADRLDPPRPLTPKSPGPCEPALNAAISNLAQRLNAERGRQ